MKKFLLLSFFILLVGCERPEGQKEFNIGDFVQERFACKNGDYSVGQVTEVTRYPSFLYRTKFYVDKEYERRFYSHDSFLVHEGEGECAKK